MFVTTITTSKIKAVKSNLLHHASVLDLGSSHLTEAFASSIGFKTHAALAAEFNNVAGPKLVKFDEDEFFNRLADLSICSVAELKSVGAHWPSRAFSRGVGLGDLRQSSHLSDQTNEGLEKLFQMMASKGVSFYQIRGSRPAYEPEALWFGSYQPGGSAMRPAFLPPTPFTWDKKSWSSQLAEDVLEDIGLSDHQLMKWAHETHDAFSRDLGLHDVVFSVKYGLLVNHEDFEGCSRSVLFQRSRQLADIMTADMQQLTKSEPKAA